MENGFLGNNASLMLDFVVCALVLVVPILLFSIYTVKFRRNYHLHRIIQISLAVVLLVTVAAFEIDIRLHGGWINIVNKNQAAPRLFGDDLSFVQNLLYVHLLFAITTPIAWGVTIFLALKKFPRPLAPNGHSKLHKLLGWISTIDITMTSATGLLFYYYAFMQ